jgi:hypothetical protein
MAESVFGGYGVPDMKIPSGLGGWEFLRFHAPGSRGLVVSASSGSDGSSIANHRPASALCLGTQRRGARIGLFAAGPCDRVYPQNSSRRRQPSNVALAVVKLAPAFTVGQRASQIDARAPDALAWRWFRSPGFLCGYSRPPGHTVVGTGPRCPPGIPARRGCSDRFRAFQLLPHPPPVSGVGQGRSAQEEERPTAPSETSGCEKGMPSSSWRAR